MEKRQWSSPLWYYVYAALFAMGGIAGICLDRVYDYTVPMTVLGICWLVLAAGAVLMARAAGRSGRNFQPLLWTCACGMFGAAGLYQGLAGRDAFQQFLGTLWLILAAAWLVRAVRALREQRSDSKVIKSDNKLDESHTQ